MKFFILAITAILIGVGWFIAPTDAEIAECVRVTNFPPEMCRFELGR